MRLFGHLSAFTLATGATSALSLVSTLLVARQLTAADFVTVNVVLLVANIAAQLGAGFDSAASRQSRAQSIGRADAVLWTLSWRAILGIVSLPFLGICIVVVTAKLPVQSSLLALGAIVANATALGLMSTLLVLPQADGNVKRFGWRQVIYYGPLLFAVALSTMARSLDVTLASLCISAGVTILVALFLLVNEDGLLLRRPALGPSVFRRLSFSILWSGALFTVGDRVDVILAASFLSAEQAARYAVTSRLTVLFAILVSASQSMNISVLSGVRTRGELDKRYKRQWPLFLGAALCVLLWAPIAPRISYLLFGHQYVVHAGDVLLLSVPFILYLLYSPYTLALASLGHVAQLTIVSLVGAAVKIGSAAVAASFSNVTWLYASSLLGAAAATATAFLLRWTR